MSDEQRRAGLGGGPSLVDTDEVDDGWGDGVDDDPRAPPPEEPEPAAPVLAVTPEQPPVSAPPATPAQPPDPLPPSRHRLPPPPRSTRPEPETRLSASEGEVIAVDPDTIDSGVLVPEPAAPSATPSAPTAPQPDAPTVPIEAQPTMPMPIAVAVQAAQAHGVGAAPSPGDPTAPRPVVAPSPPVAVGAPSPGAFPAATPVPGDRGPSLKIGPLAGPLAAVVIIVLGAGWLVAAVLVLWPIVAPATPEPVEATGVSAAAAVGVQAVAADRRAAQERAGAGDADAVEKLAGVPPEARTAAEALALARGRRAMKLGELVGLEQQFQAQPELAKDPKLLGKLHRQAYDAQLTEEALRVMAGLPGEAGADLLYAVWTHTNRRTPTTTLARDLLLSKEVADKASPALTVVLALRAADDCETRKKLLADAQDHGDARALRQLNLLKLKTGCGPKKKADCHPCLRAGTALSDAIKGSVARRPPRY